MVDRKLIASAIAVALTGTVYADKGSDTGPFGFEPIRESASSAEWNPAAPWKLPEGFEQSVVSNEQDLNIYDDGRDDWNDMNTVNESGRNAGRYLYRTHEVRIGTEYPEGGAVSVVDLATGGVKVLAQDPTWTALDGIRWTPWRTILFAEETTGGRLFEVELDKKNPLSGTVIDRPAVGRLAHEGVEVGRDGEVYVVDEHRGLTQGCDLNGDGANDVPCGGGIYKFVPETYGDLSKGDLYVLGIVDGDPVEGTGQAQWLGPIDPKEARASGTLVGGQSYQRPEDIEILGDTLYVAITEGTPDDAGNERYDGRVIAVDLRSMTVTNFVMPGVNVDIEVGRPDDTDFQTGFDNPDNLAQTRDGKLVVIEDNVPSDIWVAGRDQHGDGYADGVWLFGSLTDPSAEGTGIYFGKDPGTMFVNVQHSAAEDGDGTWAITKVE